ncbi:hypothetical protein AWB64_03883 [Caballeronia sordidicola]|uniref:Uncharacterized protein n=1 Tax=Caballeronia sordidicola TaxID=196367 RepID=A0A158H0L7_CABSO|nr:hypothetical protein AWB64_03883 [Caballeronia sordidicola]
MNGLRNARRKVFMDLPTPIAKLVFKFDLVL